MKVASPISRDETKAQVDAGRHKIDTEQCEIQWIGRNLIGMHTGTLKLLSGTFFAAGGEFPSYHK